MERPGPSEVTGSDVSGPDPQLAVTMGFTGFGKKARTFDLEAMFEQTRRTAVERSRKTLEAREKEEEMNKEKELRRQNEDTEPTSSGSNVVRDCSKSSSSDTSSSGSEESDSSDDELIGPPLPPKMVEERVTHMEEDISRLPPPLSEEQEDDDDDDDGDSEEEENPVQKIPDSHEITLKHGTKTVSALGLDPSGARLVTGGYDYDVKFWDFAGMDASFKAFRSLQPCECHQIKSLQYSNTGDMILVVSGSSQAKVIDRDGFEVMECIKGDQYIVDMANTKGHTAMLHTGSWHPKIKGEFMTCSNDASAPLVSHLLTTPQLWHISIHLSQRMKRPLNQPGDYLPLLTVRTWEVENPKKQRSVFKPRTMQGKKVIPTTCTYSRDGNLIAAACQNGSIQIWDRNLTVHPKFHYKQAHDPGTDTSCVTFSYDGNVLASRGGDDTLKLWDIRQFNKPLFSASGLPTMFPMTDCCFSPDDKLLVTGTSVQRGCGSGKLVFFERRTFQRVYEIDITDASVVRCLWHPKLNQIMVGTGNGLAKVYYDPNKSQRGAKLCVVKTQRKAKQAETLTQDYIITPHALPMFREPRQRSTRKQLEKDRLDPLKSHKPEPPVAGPGRGGRVGTHGGTLSSYIVKNIALDKTDDSNPREAILRHAKAAEDNPYWVSPAYSKTQPQAMFAQVESDDEEAKNEPEWKKRKI
ncbi:WD repeat domain 70 [Rhinolophus ferrumequinum]|uniref:WD repeat-containing protein 70 n=1 Tax=Rhinolophus ferrumequinum TaxID=59479 RepID=A0A7J7Y744_RHIFE|nr:WD repeat domain 70 [Rhinolophus ferrumequinum]